MHLLHLRMFLKGRSMMNPEWTSMTCVTVVVDMPVLLDSTITHINQVSQRCAGLVLSLPFTQVYL